MPLGFKAGGRVAGTPNRRTKEVREMLDSLGCDPIEGVARIAENPRNSAELRGRMYAELAQYIYSKRKALDHVMSAADQQNLNIRIVRLEAPDQRGVDPQRVIDVGRTKNG